MINIELFQKALDKLEEDFQPVDLFALLLREDAPDVWDLVVSAEWIGDGGLEKLRPFTAVLQNIIGDEIIKLSRIVPLRHDDESLLSILRTSGDTNQVKEIHGMSIRGMNIIRGYILKANADLLHKVQA